jgi:hypothetical protein
MKNVSAAILVACLLALPAASAESPASSNQTAAADIGNQQSLLRGHIVHRSTFVQPKTNVLADRCCKVCHAGKACGNSCISRDKTCHQPPGCACDG